MKCDDMRYDMKCDNIRYDMKCDNMKYGAFVKVFVDGKFLIKTKETNEVNSSRWNCNFVTPMIFFDTKIEME